MVLGCRLPVSDPVEFEPGTATYSVSLPQFEGPLDLLLHLCQKHELDILDIPISFVTKKYLEYLSVMQLIHLDVAAEYLVMAATLAHIKSKMLLPLPPPGQEDEVIEEEEEDPREALIRRLLEYQKYKLASQELEAKGIAAQNVFLRGGKIEEELETGVPPLAQIPLFRLIEAFQGVLAKSKITITHDIVADRISITDRIHELAAILEVKRHTLFEDLFEGLTSKFDLVITFLALLEMTRLRMTRLFQTDAYSPLYVEYTAAAGDPLPDGLEAKGIPAWARPKPPDPTPPLKPSPPLPPEEPVAEAPPSDAPVAEPEGPDADLSETSPADVDGPLSVPAEPLSDAGPPPDLERGSHAADQDDPPNLSDELHDGGVSDPSDDAEHFEISDDPELAMLEEEAADGPSEDDAWTTDAALVDDGPNAVEVPETITATISDANASANAVPFTEVGEADEALALAHAPLTSNDSDVPARPGSAPLGSDDVRLEAVTGVAETVPHLHTTDASEGSPSGSEPIREPTDSVPSAIASKPSYAEADPDPVPPAIAPPSRPEREPAEAPDFVEAPEPAPELEPESPPDFEPEKAPEFVPEPEPAPELERERAPEFEPATFPEFVPEPERAPEIEPRTPAEIEPQTAPEFEPATPPELVPEPEHAPEIEPDTRPAAPEFEPATAPELLPEPGAPEIELGTQPELETDTRPAAPEFEPATFPEFVPVANGPDPVSELAPPARTTEIEPRDDRTHADLVEAATVGPAEAELEDAVSAAESPASFSEHENEDADGALLSDPEGPDEPTP